MALKTYQQQAEELEAVITALTSAGGVTTYQVGDVQVTRAELPGLYKELRRLRVLAGRESGSMGAQRAVPNP